MVDQDGILLEKTRPSDQCRQIVGIYVCFDAIEPSWRADDNVVRARGNRPARSRSDHHPDETVHPDAVDRRDLRPPSALSTSLRWTRLDAVHELCSLVDGMRRWPESLRTLAERVIRQVNSACRDTAGSAGTAAQRVWRVRLNGMYGSGMSNDSGRQVGSVDNALQLLLLLGERRVIRVVDVAAELGVARSTAHRLLTTLLYRDFVVQDAQKAYRLGPVMTRTEMARTSNTDLRVTLRPYLEELNRRVGETCHLVVLEGNGARFIDCVESSQILRTGSRLGMLMPAHTNSGGKALLAEMSPRALQALYPRGVPSSLGEAIAARRTLQRQLAETRRVGYATNFEESAQGVTAVGACVRARGALPVAAIAIACPSARCPKGRISELAEALLGVCEAAQKEF